MIKKSFTLIEFSLVLLLIGLLSGLTLPLIKGSFTQLTFYTRSLALVNETRFLEKNIINVLEFIVPQSARYYQINGEDALVFSPLKKTVAFNTDNVSDSQIDGFFDSVLALNVGQEEFFVANAAPESANEEFDIYKENSRSRKNILSTQENNSSITVNFDPSEGFDSEDFVTEKWNRGYITSKPFAFVCIPGTPQSLKLYYDIENYDGTAAPVLDEQKSTLFHQSLKVCEIKYAQTNEQIIDGFIEIFLKIQ